VLLHPHPDMGGDRHNRVVDALYRALPCAGVTALRFDFSSSTLDAARAETIEALDLLDTPPLFVVAYSFGGGVAATITDERIAGYALVAPAISMFTPAIGADPRPKVVLAAEHDQFFAPDALAAATTDWTNVDLATITGADHFFGGRTDAVVAAVLDWLRRVAR
jgi:alpha/beta superfamily hydrolase